MSITLELATSLANAYDSRDPDARQRHTREVRAGMLNEYVEQHLQRFYDESPEWGREYGTDSYERDGVRRHMLASPASRPISVPMFMSWMRQQHIGPFAAATAEVGTPSLPTSPQQAFATADAAAAACEAWATDTDPRLPAQRCRRSHGYDRTGAALTDNQARNYAREAREGWSADNFESGTDYAQGFWRDVRDLGYGTPAWSAVSQGDTASVVPIGPGHPGWAAWWAELRTHAVRDGYMSYYNRLASAMGGDGRPRHARIYLQFDDIEMLPGETTGDTAARLAATMSGSRVYSHEERS